VDQSDLWAYRSDLLFFARSRIADPEEAADLVGDAYATAVANWSQFDGALPRAWMFALLRNRIGNARASWANRRRLGPAPGLEPIDASNPETEALGAMAVAACLAALSPDLQAVMRAVYIEGLTYEDAAKVLGVSRGILNSRISTARRNLRACLRKDELV
jgi:RNA polymerase sigma-70 factor (ECF subfamily)